MTGIQHLSGSVAVVTGGSRGIGLEVARALIAAGASVVINGRDDRVVSEAVSDLGERATGVAGSAASPETMKLLSHEAGALGSVDIVINCAGIAEPVGSSILDLDLADWDSLISSHLTTSFLVARTFAPHMARAGQGAIVFTSSHAFTGAFGGTGYAAGKGGVNSLTYALAAELKEHGVRVNAVCPGAETRLSTGDDYESTVERLHQRGILDDLMHAGAVAPPPSTYVASLYAFLASELAAGITGRVFSGAGGYIGEFSPPSEQMLAYADHAQRAPYSLDEVATIVSSKPKL